MDWYRKANEYTGVDGISGAVDIAEQGRLRANQFNDSGPQGLSPVITEKNPISTNNWIRVTYCGEEPGPSGCGREINLVGTWLNFPVNIEGKDYEAYQCGLCRHTLKPFTMEYSNRYKKRKKSCRISLVKKAQRPSTPSTYNNDANSQMGRLDLTEDQRVIPWERFDYHEENLWDETTQKGNEFKVVRIKGKDGKYRYVKVKKIDTSGSGVSPANSYTEKGRIKKQPRFNPNKEKGKKNPGAWPHNRNEINEGWYNQTDTGDTFNADLRTRSVPWNEYVTDRGQHGLLKPY